MSEQNAVSTGHLPPSPEPYGQDTMEVTSAAAWNSPRKQGFMVTLPSGNVCRVKRLMDMKALAEAGRIPNPLGKHVVQMIESGNPTVDLQTLSPHEQIQAVLFIDEQVCRMMIEPRCMVPPEKDDQDRPIDAENWMPPPGFISILDLTSEDRLFLFNVSQGGPTALIPFREVTQRIVAAVESVQDVPRPTKRTAQPKRTKRRS